MCEEDRLSFLFVIYQLMISCKNKKKYVCTVKVTIYALTWVLIWCLFPELLYRSPKKTLLWAYQQFASSVQKLSSMFFLDNRDSTQHGWFTCSAFCPGSIDSQEAAYNTVCLLNGWTDSNLRLGLFQHWAANLVWKGMVSQSAPCNRKTSAGYHCGEIDSLWPSNGIR